MQLHPTRTRLFYACAAVLALGLLELGSFVLGSLVYGTWMTPAELRRQRQARLAVEIETAGGDASTAGGPVDRPRLAISILHPFLGYVRDPARAGAGYHPEALEHGFQHRGPIFYEPSPRRTVVAVLGGSVARSLAVEAGVLAAALAATPRFADQEVEVVALAAGGYKQPQQLMTLAYFLALEAHFDVVINLDGYNEVALPPRWNVAKGVFPAYPQHWPFWAGDLDLEERRRIGETVYLRDRRQRLAQRFSGFPLRLSLTAGMVWRSLDGALEERLAAALEALRTSGTDPPGNHDYQGRGPRRTYASREAMFRDLAGLWRQTSLEIHALATGMGVEYHHFLQPNQYFPGSKPLTAEELRVAYDPRHPHRKSVEEGYPLLLEAGAELRARGVSFHDLSPVFGDRSETLYRDSCCHLNRRGNEILAGAVAGSIGG